MELCLGTVQFGLPYGIGGRDTPVAPAEVRAILALAQSGGIYSLDTAAAYGDIEERLRFLCTGLDFKVVSKIPSIPSDIPLLQRTAWVASKIEKSIDNLGERLSGLMFHQPKDLLGPDAALLWSTAAGLAKQKFALGVSCYTTSELDEISKRFAVEIAQVPGNALDQQLSTYRTAATVWLRSAFLQGALLMNCEVAVQKLPQASPWLHAWHRWCNENGYSPLKAALGIVKAMAGVDYCVVGVDSASQLEEILVAWEEAPVLQAPNLACNLAQVTDPRLWKK